MRLCRRRRPDRGRAFQLCSRITAGPGGYMISSTDGAYGPETLKMLCKALDHLVRLTMDGRPVLDLAEDMELRRQFGEILLSLHAEGERNPIKLRHEALERFRASEHSFSWNQRSPADLFKSR